MATDRARRSHDPRQKYRSVVWQQGRVTVEADGNEAEELRADEARAELRDLIGPAGTPDNGFRITVPDPPPAGWAPFDFGIGKGTYYVGGVRVTQPADTTYFGQRLDEWIDGPPPPDPQTIKSELVYLELTEEEVSAVEDAALREVALGGPDTAARTRLLQHVARLAVDATECGGALDAAAKLWSAAGLQLDRATMELRSTGRLRVDFVPATGPSDPCQPIAQAGFLGPENQLIRVQVTGDRALLWGYDNASFLYRVTASDATTLALASVPVDVFHQPRADQWVEVLAATVKLGNGEYMAAPTGFVVQLQSGYETAGQTVTLKTALPAVLLDTTRTPRLFLRVWENRLAFAGDGTTATELVGSDGRGTGVRVITKGAAVPGDAWLLGVRPDQPQQIFPPRYLADSQPPDGPRRLVAPLGVLRWTRNAGQVGDCRTTFCNLAEACAEGGGGCCCSVSITPGDLASGRTLQKIVDELAATAKGEPFTVCFGPGTYRLDRPLRLTAAHAGLKLEGCAAGATLSAAPGSEREFLDGVIVLAHANNVTLEDLRIQMPAVDFARAGGKLSGVTAKVLAGIEGPRIEDLHVSIGVRSVHSAELTVRNCLFRFVLEPGASVFAAGIFAGSECWGLIVEGCRFLHDEEYLREARAPLRYLVGYLLLPSTAVKLDERRLSRLGALEGSTVRTVLSDARFAGNEFAGLTAAIQTFAETGDVWLADNKVKDCYAGFLILALRTLGLAGGFTEVTFTKTTVEDAQLLRLAVLGVSFDPLLELGIVIGRAYPLPAGVSPELLVHVARRAGEEELTAGELRSRLDSEANHEVRLLFDRMVRSSLATRRGATAVADEESRFAPDLGVESAADPGLSRLGSVLAAVERRALGRASSDSRLRFTLSVEGNQIASLVEGGPSGPALMLFDYDFAVPSTVVLSSNQIRNRVPARPTAWLLFISRCAATGNVIINEAARKAHGEAFSLALQSRDNDYETVAITGNVLEGRRKIPPHVGAPPPLDSWDVFNAVWP